MNNPARLSTKPIPKNPKTGLTFKRLNSGTMSTTDASNNPMSTSTDFSTLVHSWSSMIAPASASLDIVFAMFSTKYTGSSSALTTSPVGSAVSGLSPFSNPIASCASATARLTKLSGVTPLSASILGASASNDRAVASITTVGISKPSVNPIACARHTAPSAS